MVQSRSAETCMSVRSYQQTPLYHRFYKFNGGLMFTCVLTSISKATNATLVT